VSARTVRAARPGGVLARACPRLPAPPQANLAAPERGASRWPALDTAGKPLSKVTSYTIKKQDHRGVKQVIRPMLGWQSYTVAPSTLTCIELMHMRKKRQMVAAEGIQDLTAAEQCYTLAV
jgi:hypothetical protein